MKRLRSLRLVLQAAALVGICFLFTIRAQDATEWRSGSGAWNDPTHWSAGLPRPDFGADIRGNSDVTVPAGTWVAGDLRVGIHKGDRARVEVNGGNVILTQDSLFVGEDSGGQGEFILNSGALHSMMDVFVGAATASSGRANDATLRIRGGTFLGRTLSVGFGYGSHAQLYIEGSQASAVHVFDYVYLQSAEGGSTKLSYVLDEHGVTPITIQSRVRGLRIIPTGSGSVHLEVSLRAVPPREDITLVSAHVAPMGTFDGMPEGTEITADYGGKSYRWALTYHGGPNHTDLVLQNRSAYGGDDPVTHVRSIPQPPAPLWREHPVYPLAIAAGTPAFPGAEGYGAYSRGGAGGRTIEVTNLADSGPGSLRAAIETAGPRTIVFRVGGSIALKTQLRIRNPFVTIDGHDAPPAGVTITGHGVSVRTHDVVLRYFRIRLGDEGVSKDVNYEAGEGDDALRFDNGAKDAIADHLSMGWSTGKIITVSRMADRITIQWCILSEGLNFAGHGYASLAGGNRVTWHHNLLAHNYGRNVRFQGAVTADFRNNTIYDWGENAAYGEFDRLNYVANYLKPGPSTTQYPREFHRGDAVVLPGSIFIDGNVMEGAPGVDADNWRAMGFYYPDRETLKAAEPIPAPPVKTEHARDAYERVLGEAGDTLPARDAVDQRILREVRSGTGHIIRWVREAGQ